MVRQKLRDTISIPKMKDYIESMRDKEELLSGDWDLIPSNTTVDKKLCEKKDTRRSFMPIHIALTLCHLKTVMK